MKYLLRILLLLMILVLLAPQTSLAAWWNPFTWKIFNKAKAPQAEVQKTVPASEVDKLRSEIEELKKKSNTPAVTPPKPSSSVNGATPTAVKSIPLTRLTNSQIIKKIKPAVVYIETQDSAGSGMIFTTDGYILTNAHVVEGYSVANISISSGETLSGIVVGRNEDEDLAVMKITSEKIFTKVTFGDSSKTEQGDEVFTLGFPFGIKGDVSFKEGTISRRIENYFETSAEIHPGNSGGPLVNRYGEVVGINTAIFGTTVAGVQFGETIKLAIPINVVKNYISDLRAGKNIVVEPKQDKVADQKSGESSYQSGNRVVGSYYIQGKGFCSPNRGLYNDPSGLYLNNIQISNGDITAWSHESIYSTLGYISFFVRNDIPAGSYLVTVKGYDVLPNGYQGEVCPEVIWGKIDIR